jgi:restriction system protein
MAIPDYQTLTSPLLRFLGDGNEHAVGEAVEALWDQFKLSAEERQEMLPSGQQTIIRNRVGWARTYMKKAGLIEATRHGRFKISTRGQDILETNPTKIDVGFFKSYLTEQRTVQWPFQLTVQQPFSIPSAFAAVMAAPIMIGITSIPETGIGIQEAFSRFTL